VPGRSIADGPGSEGADDSGAKKINRALHPRLDDLRSERVGIGPDEVTYCIIDTGTPSLDSSGCGNGISLQTVVTPVDVMGALALPGPGRFPSPVRDSRW
jgi:hypothetical protein